VRDYLQDQADLFHASRDIHGGLQDLDPQYDADVLRANKLMKDLPGTPADLCSPAPRPRWRAGNVFGDGWSRAFP
jgi:hypothetical protein